MLPHTFHTRPKLCKCLLILLKLRTQTTCHKTKLLRLHTCLCLSPAPRAGSLKSRARFSANTLFHSNRALTQETLSLANTIALGVDQLLKPSRETSAQAFHIMVGINVLTYPFEPRTELGHGLCPRLSGQSPLLTVTNPRHTRLVEEHLLTAAWSRHFPPGGRPPLHCPPAGPSMSAERRVGRWVKAKTGEEAKWE